MTLAHDRLHCGKLAAAGLAWLILANFWNNYFLYFQRTGGDSHVTFRTSIAEPKAVAIDYVLQQQGNGKPVTILTHEWWNYWPLKYLASREPGVKVMWWEELNQADLDNALRRGELCSAEFSDSTGDRESKRLFESHGEHALQTISDPVGRPILTLLGPMQDSHQKD